jgi:hypothetical protein
MKIDASLITRYIFMEPSFTKFINFNKMPRNFAPSTFEIYNRIQNDNKNDIRFVPRPIHRTNIY